PPPPTPTPFPYTTLFRSNPRFEGVLENRLEHPRRVSDPDGAHAGRDEPFHQVVDGEIRRSAGEHRHLPGGGAADDLDQHGRQPGDRKSTRLNSSHLVISY